MKITKPLTPFTKPLTPFEKWAIKSNLEDIKENGIPVAERVAVLRSIGYERIAAAVQAASAA